MDCEEVKQVNPKGNQSWIFIGRTDAETPILWPPDVKNWLKRKDPDAGKDWRQEEKGDNRGWDGWMTSLTQWTWVWVNSGSWWWTGRPGMLRFMGSQRVKHDWATELNWTMQFNIKSSFLLTYLCGNSQIWLPWRIFLKYLEWEKLKDQHSTGRPFLQSFDSRGNEPSITFHSFLSWPTYLLLFHRSHWQGKQILCHPH